LAGARRVFESREPVMCADPDELDETIKEIATPATRSTRTQ
jgi:hypothetical protein